MGQMPAHMQIIADAANGEVDSEGRSFEQRAIEDAWAWAAAEGHKTGHLRVTIFHNKRTGKLAREFWVARRITEELTHGDDCGCKRGEDHLVRALSKITDPETQLADCIKRRKAQVRRNSGKTVVVRKRKAKAAA